MAALPKSVKNVTVLDKCIEEGSLGSPLFLDVFTTIKMNRPEVNIY
jgi:hypothetical protein